MLTVDENYVQMSSFIMKNLKIESFENGRAFYEFTDEEDLIYYKEVVNGLRKKVILYFNIYLYAKLNSSLYLYCKGGWQRHSMCTTRCIFVLFTP